MVCPLSFKRFQSYYIDRGDVKFGDLVLSIVERYLIQCPFLGGFYLRGSTVVISITGGKKVCKENTINIPKKMIISVNRASL